MPDTAQPTGQVEELTKEQIPLDMPNVKDDELHDFSSAFNGQWLPNVDPLLIGPTNYRNLINMRYTDTGLEGVSGYTPFSAMEVGHANETESYDWNMEKSGTTDWTAGNGGSIAKSTTVYKNGSQSLRLTAGALDDPYVNSSQLALDDDASYTVHCYVYNGSDGAEGTKVRVFEADGDNTVYATSAACTEAAWTEVELDFTIPNGDSGNVKIQLIMPTQSVDEISYWDDVIVFSQDDSDYENLKSGIHFRTNRVNDSYILVRGEKSDGSGKVFYSVSDIGGGEDEGVWKTTQLWTDTDTDLQGRFAIGPSGVVAYANSQEQFIWGGTEANIADAFTLTADAAPHYGKITDSGASDWANPIEVADKVMNTLDDSDNYITWNHDEGAGDGNRIILLMTTRPAKGFKLYFETVNTQSANTDALEVEYWTGSAFAAVAGLSDGTSKCTQNGTISFTQPAVKPMHYLQRYLYAYILKITATAASGVDASCNIYQITADMAAQKPSNIWDGIYRIPINVQYYDQSKDAYQDFTDHVQSASTESVPVGLYLGAMQAADYVYIMFEEPCTAIYFQMLGTLVNSANSQIEAATPDGVQYWDGTAWEETSFTDETLDDAGDSSFAQSGLVWWAQPSDEQKREWGGRIGYVYRFSVDANFSAGDQDTIVVDLVTGIPAAFDMKVYDFPVTYKNKLMFASYSTGNEGNRIDYSADNAPDVFNGEDSSMNGIQSLYVGSLEKITAATQLYNRFGANIFSTLVILKNSEVWLMTGDSPLDYELFPISFSIGCPAPLTLTTAEVGYQLGEDVERNVAMWVSHQGPVMFDGAVIKPLKGIENFFDPNYSPSVNFDELDQATAWFDSTYSEWNILLPTGTSTYPDLWLVYDMRRRRWFKKSVGTATYIANGVPAISSNGSQYVYGLGYNDGHVYQLESGTSWNGTPIGYEIFTGDFFPSNNMWDITVMRRIKLVCKRLTESGASVSIFYHPNTETDAGLAVTFIDITAALAYSNVAGLQFKDVESADSADSGEAGFQWTSEPTTTLNMSQDVGIARVVRENKAMNETNWCHSLKFIFSSSETAKFTPLLWGYQWMLARKAES